MGRSSSSAVHVKIVSDFDGGNIEYVRQEPNRNDASVVDVILNIRPDVYTALEEIHHMQYFCFSSTVTGFSDENDDDGVTVRYVIDNASKASYPEAWPGTTVCYTTGDPHVDVDSWRRNVDTYYTQSQLHWEHVHKVDGETTCFAYFPIYSRQRHDELLDKCRTAPACQEVLVLGRSIQGRNIDCVVAGTGSAVAWIIHQQHPGETMAEHYAEGLLYRLLGLDDDDASPSDKALVDTVLGQYTFYVVPNMNPDGAFLGHLRTNAVGANLNREWADSVKKPYEAPTLERSPEVYCVLEKMKETGVDMFLDVHGDEELPFNFTSGSNGIPNWGPRLERLLGAFTNSYARFNSDMQSKYGYPNLDASQVSKYMNVATNQVGYRFDCLAVTLEMPFKDCRSNPDPDRGWSPARCRALGASLVQVLDYVHPHLRGNSWQHLPDEDRYIETTDNYSNDRGDHGEEQFQMLKQRFYSDVHEIRKPPSTFSRPPQKPSLDKRVVQT